VPLKALAQGSSLSGEGVVTILGEDCTEAFGLPGHIVHSLSVCLDRSPAK
jgi:hypothetical protein